MSVKDRIKRYEDEQKQEKERIKAMPKGAKRFWTYVGFILVWPFKWLWINLRDWRTFLIFALTFLVVSSEVWVPYLIGFIIPSTRAVLWSIASACWIFWLGPGTPFIPLCIAITIGIKAALDGISHKMKQKKQKKLEQNNEQQEPEGK